MTQRESRLSQKIQKALREEKVFCFKVHGSALMTAGLPDIIACVDGQFIGFEVKHEETRSQVSPRQAFIHNQIRSAGGKVWVICSASEARFIVRSIRAGA